MMNLQVRGGGGSGGGVWGEVGGGGGEGGGGGQGWWLGWGKVGGLLSIRQLARDAATVDRTALSVLHMLNSCASQPHTTSSPPRFPHLSSSETKKTLPLLPGEGSSRSAAPPVRDSK